MGGHNCMNCQKVYVPTGRNQKFCIECRPEMVMRIKRICNERKRSCKTELERQAWRRESGIRVSQWCKENGFHLSSEEAERRRQVCLRQWTDRTEGEREKILSKLNSKEVQLLSVAGNRREVKTNRNRGRFESNVSAEWWHMRDPRGIEYHFRNLRNFIREHRNIFTERQLECPGRDNPERTRVENCLGKLSPGTKNPATTAQGWSWIGELNFEKKEE